MRSLVIALFLFVAVLRVGAESPLQPVPHFAQVGVGEGEGTAEESGEAEGSQSESGTLIHETSQKHAGVTKIVTTVTTHQVGGEAASPPKQEHSSKPKQNNVDAEINYQLKIHSHAPGEKKASEESGGEAEAAQEGSESSGCPGPDNDPYKLHTGHAYKISAYRKDGGCEKPESKSEESSEEGSEESGAEAKESGGEESTSNESGESAENGGEGASKLQGGLVKAANQVLGKAGEIAKLFANVAAPGESSSKEASGEASEASEGGEASKKS